MTPSIHQMMHYPAIDNKNKAFKKMTDTINKTKSLFANFLSQNPHASASYKDELAYIEKPWGNEDVRLKIRLEDHETISVINNIALDPQFDAVFHPAQNLIEFIFSFVAPDSKEAKDIINRNFLVHFKDSQVKCFFDKPTSDFFCIAKCFERVPTEDALNTIPQMSQFTYWHRKEELPEFAKDFYDNRIPLNFFIQPNRPLQEINILELANHLNFLINYYDRDAPIISINQVSESKKTVQPVRYISHSFPHELALRPIDDVILKLIEVARGSQARFSFIYYYQVLEYAAHYYIDAKAKAEIRSLLRDPAIICGEDEIFSKFFSKLIDTHHNDDVKIRNVIQTYCDPSVIWKEIENDKFFFSQAHIFQGGFKLDPLINEKMDEDIWKTMWMPKLCDYLTKIRNALVHAREKRENKVILPTSHNNRILKGLNPVMARVAEQVALKSEC